MRVVEVPFGIEQSKYDFLQEAVNGEPAELVRALVPMEEVQASFQILHLSATSACHICSEQFAFHHMPSCCKLRRFGGVGVGVYHLVTELPRQG